MMMTSSGAALVYKEKKEEKKKEEEEKEEEEEETSDDRRRRSDRCSLKNPRTKVACYAALAIASRVVFFVVTPLWLDFFHSRNSTAPGNATAFEDTVVSSSVQYYHALITETFAASSSSSEGNNASRGNCSHTPNPFFAVLGQWTFSTVVFGLCSLLILLVRPEAIRNQAERSYPMRNFVIIGTSQGLSSILMAYSISGSRTPPYLQAILINFVIPIQFTVRFIVLRKRPTLLKGLCASVVALCEFVCLIPTIFPSLEDQHQHQDEGGSTGPDRFLWPIFFVCSSIPYALANSIMERGMQSEKTSPSHDTRSNTAINNGGFEGDPDQSRDATTTTSPSPSPPPRSLQLNLFYFNFWWTLYVVVTLLGLFWFDVLPVVGTSHSVEEFGCQMWFNLRCIFGGANCVQVISVLGWIDFISVFFANIALAGLMRHSEGANFVMVLMTVRTPIIFLFWTLFVEQPFSWQPHVGLSTWLSIGSIVVMITAIVLYDRAPMEVDVGGSRREDATDDERRPLIAQTSPTSDIS